MTIPHQDEILRYITDFTLFHGYAPSVREVGQAVGLTSSDTIHQCLKRLKKAGLVNYVPKCPRTLTVVR